MSGQGTKIFVSEPYLPNQETPFQELRLVNEVNVGDAYITVEVGCEDILYEGTRIGFGTEAFPKPVYVAVQTPAETVNIPISKSKFYIPAGATAKLESYIPLFSAKQANADNQLQTFNDQNFSSYKPVTAPSGISAQGSVSGVVVKGDPGHKRISQASKGAKVCKVEILDSAYTGGNWAEAHFGFNKQRANNQYNQVVYTIFPIHKWKEYKDPPEVALFQDVEEIVSGNTITFTIESIDNGDYNYTITGVDSADIDGAPLTGTFSGAGDTLTLTTTSSSAKTLTITIDGKNVSRSVLVVVPFYELTTSATRVGSGESFTISLATNTPSATSYTITGVTTGDINNTPLTGSFNNGSTRTFSFVGTVDKTFTLSLDNGKADISVTLLIKTFYCPQTIPNYTIDFATVYTFTDTNYCPQTIPDYTISYPDPIGEGVYCSQDMLGLFDSPLTGTGVYCSQDTSGLFASPLTGTGVYCSHNIDWPLPPADGVCVYCEQGTSSLPNPYSPIPADGTITYCQQDTSGLPTP